ncbi:MAG: MarR family transcriptional regulator [Acidobacteriia bacterium]|nr:MarR family transcriptional regulator [Terriglobia bacterium]
MTPARDLSLASYRHLAEFRHQIRKFIRYSEDAARAHGTEPQQHQLLLAIKGLPAGKLPTISELADRLQIRHHSAVELINRLADHGAVIRETAAEDRREVLIRLTPAGERTLRALSLEHRNELRKAAPQLMKALDSIMKGSD